MCIKDKWEGKPVEHGLKHPQIGDIDEVVGVFTTTSVYYKLHGYGDNRGFRSDYFATLPDEPAEVIEEPEMMEA